MIKVCVIGAGAAGLAALRHLTAEPTVFRAVGYELSAQVGGTWVYTDKTGRDEDGLPVYGSMYANLRTNLPKEVMAFPDHPFNGSLPSFISHDDVKDYLHGYAERFKLFDYIQFRKEVSLVKSFECDGKTCWEVRVKDVGKTTPEEVSYFDAVMVCNGHYFLPLVPELEGITSFKGQILHSHVYRRPDGFKGRTVLILGRGSSGQDISLDLAPRAKQVIMSHNKADITAQLPANVVQRSGVKRLTVDGAVLNDGSEVKFDTLLLCTGYKFSFPFLSQECTVSLEKERITPLYKHLIHINHPTLCLVGICKVICPFPQFHCQVVFFLRTLTQEVRLPSVAGMRSDEAADFQARRTRGMPARHAHHMGTLQWAYNDDLARLGYFERIPRGVQKLYDYVHEQRITNLVNYKDINYVQFGDDYKTVES